MVTNKAARQILFNSVFLSSIIQISRKLLIRMNSMANGVHNRGALIVLEGCDRSGKTTQCKNLVNHLNEAGYKAMYLNFPARETKCGSLIDSYLTNKMDMNDESIHLLFTLNRWEFKDKMQKLLEDGITLIVDRYSYSGVAFSAAKGLDFEWCKAPERGLFKPDLVLFLTLSSKSLSKRGGFGDERYEKIEFQEKVYNNFRLLKDEKYWKEINADKSQEDLLIELKSHTIAKIKESGDSPLKLLW